MTILADPEFWTRDEPFTTHCLWEMPDAKLRGVFHDCEAPLASNDPFFCPVHLHAEETGAMTADEWDAQRDHCRQRAEAEGHPELA